MQTKLKSLLIFIYACLPLESQFNKSGMHVSPVELFEFLNVSFNAVTDALASLLLSSDSESVGNEQGIAFPEAAAFDLSVDTMKAQCQPAEEILSSLHYLLQRDCSHLTKESA